MRTILLTLPIWLVGCGGVGGAASYCSSIGSDPNAVRTFYSLVQADRDAGFTVSEELEVVLLGCSDQTCINCATAIVDEVYGL